MPGYLLKYVFINVLMGEVNDVRMKLLAIKPLYILERWFFHIVMSLQDVADRALDHTKRRESQQVKLNKPQWLQVSDGLSLGPR